MLVLVTRPKDDCDEIAQILRPRGHQVLVAPLLALEFWDGPEISLEGVQAILATSANGIRALGRRTPRRDVPVFAVGPQTAAQAQSLGFASVRNADGNADDLAAATRAWASPAQGALLHVAGEGNDAKLVGALGDFTVRQEILYAVKPAQQMPPDAVAALAAGRIDAALFFSPRSAVVFRDCLGELPVAGVMAVCISPATAAALAPLAFAKVCVAARPNQAALLELLDQR